MFNGLQKPVDTVTVELILTEGVPHPPDLNDLSHAEKDALIRALWQRLEAAEQRIAELETRLGELEDTEQFQPTAIEGSEAEQARDRQAYWTTTGQPGPQRRLPSAKIRVRQNRSGRKHAPILFILAG